MKQWFKVKLASRMFRAIVTAAVLSCFFGANAAVWAANPAPVQLFYVPIPEDQLLTALQSIQSTDDKPVNPVQTYISIAAIADNTRIYYDQWENGYDLDIANPTNVYSAGNLGGTQIWGDNDPSNGIPPGFADDIIDAGDVIILNNAVTTTNLTAIDFDGRDKIAATKTIAISRAGWASESRTLLAGANEVFDTSNWGTEYRVPVGEDIPTNQMYDMFQYTGMTIMAGPGGATVELDIDGNGSPEAVLTLAEGESHLVDGGIEVGGRVASDRAVQIDLITGDINGSYEARFFRLLPVALWSGSSYTPVSTPSSASIYSGTDTTVWLYNPHSLDITVQYQRRSGGSLHTTALTVPAGGYLKQIIPNGSGAHFYTASGDKFYALTTIDSTDSSNGESWNDSGNRVWDWGFTLVPEDSLTPQVLIGLGIGRDPTSSENPNENASPIWVTPVGNGNEAVTIYIDFDADPLTGPNTDPNGNRYDSSVNLKELQTAKIYDSDGDQTRTLVYTFEPGVKLAAAWGEDPLTASVGQPGLDMGTGIPPLPLFDVSKSAALETDNDQDGFISPGDVLKYTILITNISRAPVPDILLIDNLPQDTAYIADSTFFKNASNVTSQIPDDGVGTAFPLDEGGRILDDVTALPVGGSYEVTFKVIIDSFENLNSETSEIINTGLASAVGTKVRFEARTPLFGRLGNFVWSDTNGNGLQDVGEAGVNGLTVQLLDAGGTPIAAAVTADDGGGDPGYYEFKGLLPGNYVVAFTTLNGCIFTTKNSDGLGIDGPFNSDANIADGRTDPFFLAAGQNNPNIDAGIICPAPSLTLDKTTTTANYDGTGDIISYAYKLSNSGNVPLRPPYAVSDNKATVTCPQTPDPLNSGEFLTCTAQYAVSQVDLDIGSVTNTATASATYGDSSVTSNQDQVTVYAAQNGALTIVKTATPATYDAVGDIIQYSFLVTNTGNVTLSNISVADDKATDENCTVTSLAPLASTTCTASYAVTQADLDAGSLTNTATASGSEPNGDPVNSPPDSETVTAAQNGALTIVKTATPATYDAVGDIIQYSFLVTNTGNVTLSSISVADDKATDENCTVTSLAPLASTTCTASYAVTQADLDAGSLTNTATASGSEPNGDPVNSPPDSETVTAAQNGALTIVKTATPATYDAVGDIIQYSFLVTNTGNVTLSSISVADDKATDENCTVTSLAPLASTTCTASYAVTQADLDAGSLTNTATASGSEPNGDPVTSPPDSETVTAAQNGALTIVKTATPATYDAVGDVIQYSFLVTNTGNVTLSNISVADDKATDENCTVTSLAPLASTTCTASYAVTQADLDAGSLTNTATASGSEPNGDPVTSPPDSETVTAAQNGALTIVKTATPATYDAVGDIIQYSFLVTNTGNVTLSNISVADDKATDENCTVTSLAPLASTTCTASYAVTQADLDAGSLTNTATASGSEPNGDPVTSPPDSETVTAAQNTAIELQKMGDYIDNDPLGVYNAGDEISYVFRVTNKGNVTLTNITISDAIPEVTVSGGPIDSLDPGQTDTATFTGSYTLTQNDIDAGKFTNTATAFGTPPSGPNISDDDDDTQPMTTSPALDLVKTADPMEYESIDQVIVYSFEVTNIGNVTINGPITIDDDKATDEFCPTGDLVPGGSITCSATYTITQDDLDAGTVTNVATASGLYNGQTVTSNEDTVSIIAAIGVCCLPDGQCVIVTEQECTQQDGIFDGTLRSCEGVNCFITQGLGACCLPDGTCVDWLHEAECIDRGGEFMGVGVECTQGLCPRPAMPVPTISAWGLMVLSMLTGGLAVLALRRRSKKS